MLLVRLPVNRRLVVIKILERQKLYMDLWIFDYGVDRVRESESTAPSPSCLRVNCRMSIGSEQGSNQSLCALLRHKTANTWLVAVVIFWVML